MKKSRTVALKVVKSRAHFFLLFLVLAVNLVLLMSLHFPHNKSLDSAICEFHVRRLYAYA